jgi:molybdopterin/thiamine biosynthesis adenylyltransferase
MIDRYIRQTTFPPIGTSGQALLRDATVLLVGCGGLGSVSADILARAGIGTLRIADRDIVELSNLQRQVLFDMDDVRERTPKAEAAANRLRRINPEIDLQPRVVDVNAHTIPALLEGVDLIIDGTDNFETRYLLNDAAVQAGLPWVYGGAVASHGMAIPIIPGTTPCLTCLFEEMPPSGSADSCDTAGVIAPILHVIAAIQCTHALRLLTNTWESPATMTDVDIWDAQWRAIPLGQKPRANCNTCGKRHFPYLTAETGLLSTVLCGRNAVQLSSPTRATLDLEALATSLERVGDITRSPFLLTAVISPYTLTIFPDGRVVIEGTSDPTEARSVHGRYLG